jgi:hypothetical protein
MTHPDLITALGGPRQLSAALGDVRENAVSKWRIKGRIPAVYWHRVIPLAAARGLTITVEQLAEKRRVS